MSEELKACPSCGLEHPSLFEGVTHLVYYLCYGCGFAGGGCADESSAADAWNRRTIKRTQLRAMVEVLQEATPQESYYAAQNVVWDMLRAAGFEVE